jgi:hypothetical protein
MNIDDYRKVMDDPEACKNFLYEHRGYFEDLINYYGSVMQERPADEIHCTCVPGLRRKLLEVKEAVDRQVVSVGGYMCLSCRGLDNHHHDCVVPVIQEILR